jgi:hypothetical protein
MEKPAPISRAGLSYSCPLPSYAEYRVLLPINTQPRRLRRRFHGWQKSKASMSEKQFMTMTINLSYLTPPTSP